MLSFFKAISGTRETEPELPPYTIRESARARHIRIRITPESGVTVVIPKGTSHRRIPAIVDRQRDWIDKHLARFEASRAILEQRKAEADTLPGTIHLAALNATYPIICRPSKAQLRLRQQDGELVIAGDTSDAGKVRASLRRWLIGVAKEYFNRELLQLSKESGLHYRKLTVRCQKHRWGSCSPKKDISLNAKLLFLSPELARHVMLHELAHIKHMNHSPAFYRLIERLDPDWKQHSKALRHDTARHIPIWAEWKD